MVFISCGCLAWSCDWIIGGFVREGQGQMILALFLYILIGVRLVISLTFKVGLPEVSPFEVIVILIALWPVIPATRIHSWMVERKRI